jgi:hypothetical protein
MSDSAKRLSAEDLEQQIQIAEKDVELPELGGTVRVRALTKGKRDRMRRGITNPDGGITDPAEFEIRMFVAGVCEPKVSREQALRMKDRWPASMWDRVLAAIGELGGADPEEVAAAAAAAFPGADD